MNRFGDSCKFRSGINYPSFSRLGKEQQLSSKLFQFPDTSEQKRKRAASVTAQFSIVLSRLGAT